MMKTIKVKVVENGHRYHTLMNLLRQDNYDYSIEAETEQEKISFNLPVSGCVSDVSDKCRYCREEISEGGWEGCCPECYRKHCR